MNKLLSCEFNIDTGNVELRYADGSMISIDCTEVEKEVAMSINARSELDWLIYNAQLEYKKPEYAITRRCLYIIYLYSRIYFRIFFTHF